MKDLEDRLVELERLVLDIRKAVSALNTEHIQRRVKEIDALYAGDRSVKNDILITMVLPEEVRQQRAEAGMFPEPCSRMMLRNPSLLEVIQLQRQGWQGISTKVQCEVCSEMHEITNDTRIDSESMQWIFHGEAEG